MWGVPYAMFDGTDSSVGGGTSNFNTYRTKFNQHIVLPSPGILSLKVSYNPSTRTGMIFTRFHSVDRILEPSLHLRYGIIESHMHYHWYGLDSLQFILRDMVPDPTGIAFSIDEGGDLIDSQSFSINSAWVDNNCYLPVFVQSDAPKPNQKVLICNQIPLYQKHVSGDANRDGVTTISDVVFLSNYAYYSGPEPYPSASGDPNEDCVIDASDIVYLIDYLFIGGPAPLRGWEID